jgi:hypothetical protein
MEKLTFIDFATALKSLTFDDDGTIYQNLTDSVNDMVMPSDSALIELKKVGIVINENPTS